MTVPVLAGKEKEKEITLVAAGDVEWSGTWFDEAEFDEEAGSIFLDPGEKVRAQGGWQPVPRLISPETLPLLKALHPEVFARFEQSIEKSRAARKMESGVTPEMNKALFVAREPHNLSFTSPLEWATYPFRSVREVFRTADIAFVNLETPLSDEAPRTGALRTPTAFTLGLLDAGVDLVSVANNHMLDAQIWGLLDTLKYLDKTGIHHIGAGKDLIQARQSYVQEKDGIRIAFLGYSQSVNGGAIGFALPSRAGVAPLDPLLIAEDIRRIKGSVDHVVLSFHWDLFQVDEAKSFDLHPEAIAFAHQMIDAGADAILGHHPHIPRALEYYKGKPILYSMGHLIFSSAVPAWGDNYVARLFITKYNIPRVEILPVSGKMHEVAQPYFLKGERSRALLTHLQALSNGMGGRLRIHGDIGVLTDR